MLHRFSSGIFFLLFLCTFVLGEGDLPHLQNPSQPDKLSLKEILQQEREAFESQLESLSAKDGSASLSSVNEYFENLLHLHERDSSSTPQVSTGKHTVAINDPDGSINIDIPIQVPLGTNGAQPQFTISYNSNGGSNHLGQGWTMQGVTSIARCPRSIAQDGMNAAISNNASDRFCLDGQRLYVVSGAYGGDEAHYRTEVDAYVDVISHVDPAHPGSGPSSWTVRTKGGQTRTYGGDTSSQIQCSAEVNNDPYAYRVWGISIATDLSGNWVSFSYSEGGIGEYLLSEVSYGVPGISLPASRVQFNYTSRTDGLFMGAASNFGTSVGVNQVMNTKLLTSIVTSTRLIQGSQAMTPVYNYQIAYFFDSSNNEAYIDSVKQCSGSVTTNCNMPYQMTYTQVSAGPTDYPSVATSFSYSISSVLSQAQVDVARTKLADFNADGVSDVFHINSDIGGSAVASDIWISSLNSTAGSVGVSTTWTRIDGPGVALRTPVSMAQSDVLRLQLIDWNADNQMDIYEISLDGNSDKVHLFDRNTNTFTTINGPQTGRPLSTNPSILPIDIARYKFGDFSGDGRMDLYWVNGEIGTTTTDKVFLNTDGQGTYSVANGLTKPLGSSPSSDQANLDMKRYLIDDLNADGMMDIYYVTGLGVASADECWTSVQGNSWNMFEGPETFVSASTSLAENDISRIHFGDFNGDGMNDIYRVMSTGSPANDNIYFGYGNAFGPAVQTNQLITVSVNVNGASNDLDSLKFLDVNGDGSTDIYIIKAGSVDQIFISQKNGLFSTLEGANFEIDSGADRSVDLSRVLFADFSGDGAADIYYIGSPLGGSGSDVIYYSPNRRYLLTQVVNPFDLTTLIEYQPLTNKYSYTRGTNQEYPCVAVQSATYVVTKVTRDNGAGGHDLTSLVYSGAIQHIQGWGFLGYATVTTQQSSGISITSSFSQDYTIHLQYRQLEQQVTAPGPNGSVVVMDETWTFTSTPISTASGTYWQLSNTQTSNTKTDLTGSSLGTTVETNTYDPYGNILQYQSVSTDSLGTNFTAEASHSFDYNTSDWRVATKTTTKQTKYLGESSSSLSFTFSYDDFGRRIGQCALSLDSEDNGMYICVTYLLDLFGNRFNTTLYGMNRDRTYFPSRTFISDFSTDTFGRFPNTITNPLQLTETFSYDARCGMIEESIPPGGSFGLTSISYNDFCLPIRQVTRAPPGCASETKSTVVIYSRCDDSCPSNAVFYTTTRSVSDTVTWNYFDKLERIVRTKTQQFLAGYVISDLVYGSNGKIAASSAPYSTGAPSSWYNYTYDVLDRTTKISYPDGSYQATNFDGLEVTTISAIGKSFTSTSDIMQQIVRTEDANGKIAQFTYDSRGDVIGVVDCNGNVANASYDAFGLRYSLQDPDAGETTFEYDIIGQELSKTLADGTIITYNYDGIGRPIERTSKEGSTTWSYDNTNGKLVSIAFGSSCSENYLYDSTDRVTSKTVTIDSVQMETQTTYDCQSRVVDTTFPSGLRITNEYDPYSGHLWRVHDANRNVVIYEVLSKDLHGNPTQVRLNSWLDIYSTYDVMGRLTEVKGSDSVTGTLYQDLKFSWDSVNNLLQRQDALLGLTETFTYDNLNRVIMGSVSPGGYNLSLSYDEIGNVLSNSEVGAYLYGNSSGPHAVTSVKTNGGLTESYNYDANGNMVAGPNNRVITYTSFGKPSSLTDPKHTSSTFTFDYGGSLQLTKKTEQMSNNATKTTYFSDFYERTYDSMSHQYTSRNFIGSYLISTYDLSDSGTLFAVLRDHLGSVDKIIDLSSKAIVQEQSYTLTGSARDPLTWQPLTANTLNINESLTTSGFTNHMDLPSSGLVHMGGRLFDARLMRFYTPDPYSSAMGNMQSLNRYSYVLNRPLSDADPTGYHHHDGHHHFWRKLGHLFVKVVKLAIDAVLTVACDGNPACAALFNAAWRVVKDKIEGDSWKGSLFDGVCTFMSWEVMGGGMLPGDDSVGASVSRRLASGMIMGVDASMHARGSPLAFALGFMSGATMSNPQDNPFLKPGDLAGNIEDMAEDKLFHTAEKKVEKQVAKWLGVPAPIVHLSSSIILGDNSDKSDDTSMQGTDRVHNFGTARLSRRPFNVMDVAQGLAGGAVNVGSQSATKSLTSFMMATKQLGPPEVGMISTYGLFRGALPLNAISDGFPGETPGGNQYLGSLSAVAYCPLVVIVHPDARFTPGSSSAGILVNSNQWGAFTSVLDPSLTSLWDQSSPTSGSSAEN